ncbi:MAG: hypothetical protein A2519_14180 [Candidatus Raymondbacteria bacterium RIFOXYD12_FULL_49_13]|uniref:FlgO domain-containing protein n=1 Tax=Candidatus Raymondbacteria bacterium RIFOXYD12_FULL_49_13 TaxID=1817890 RepID=A0A1F7FKS8_UNCRA|nr:MAG: hypothetical protein A2519_14180 [Candidatus Raymondbacteria bacterium RIFOXYD12_FULL_49_13]
MLFPLFVFAQQLTVGVMPFANNSLADREAMQPLCKGLADMMTTEMGKIKSITVIERANLEKVIAEMGLAQAGLVDEASAAQAGKLLGADILLLGGFNNSFGGEIRIDARLVKVETGEMVKAEEITGSTKKLFKLLKKLSFKMAGNLDLKLTKDEKKALDNLDNEDFEALMCYSKGLEAEDAADYALAAQMYRKALSLNSSYAKAAERLAIVERKKLK